MTNDMKWFCIIVGSLIAMMTAVSAVSYVGYGVQRENMKARTEAGMKLCIPRNREQRMWIDADNCR